MAYVIHQAHALSILFGGDSRGPQGDMIQRIALIERSVFEASGGELREYLHELWRYENTLIARRHLAEWLLALRRRYSASLENAIRTTREAAGDDKRLQTLMTMHAMISSPERTCMCGEGDVKKLHDTLRQLFQV